MQDHSIGGIDLLCVNLYPFEQTLAAGGSYEELVENILQRALHAPGRRRRTGALAAARTSQARPVGAQSYSEPH